jgi:hypothetical protein
VVFAALALVVSMVVIRTRAAEVEAPTAPGQGG